MNGTNHLNASYQNTKCQLNEMLGNLNVLDEQLLGTNLIQLLLLHTKTRLKYYRIKARVLGSLCLGALLPYLYTTVINLTTFYQTHLDFPVYTIWFSLQISSEFT